MTRPDNFDSAYFDSCLFLSVLEKEDGYQLIEQLLQLVFTGQLELVVSPFVLLEARGRDMRTTVDEHPVNDIWEQLNRPGVLMMDFDRFTAVKARELAVQHRLKNCDAVHLATAVAAEVDVMFTLDNGFPLGKSIDSVWVDRPYLPGGPNLFSQN